MIVGVLAGLVAGERAVIVQPIGDLFLRLLLMAAIPLVFFVLLAGITGLQDAKSFGRIGGKILVFFLVTTVIAILLGIGITEFLQPGSGIAESTEAAGTVASVPDLGEILLALVPDNVFASFAQGDVTQIVVFAVLLGLATLTLNSDHRAKVHAAFTLGSDLLRALVELILRLAPLGIGALAAATVGRYGTDIFGSLALFIGGVWAAHLAMAAIYALLVAVMSRYSVVRFFRDTGPLYATTASTCSSLASLVVSMDIAEKKLKLPRAIYSFTLPLGSQLNKDGTAIMLAAALMFTAQVSGIEIETSSYLTVVIVGLLLSFGSGGIPGGGLVIALIYVQAFGLPTETAALVGGVYRLVDMGNTTINCMGDMVGTVIVERTEDRTSAD
jgi:Na+/H+-dicarboxylate symporter